MPKRKTKSENDLRVEYLAEGNIERLADGKIRFTSRIRGNSSKPHTFENQTAFEEYLNTLELNGVVTAWNITEKNDEYFYYKTFGDWDRCLKEDLYKKICSGTGHDGIFELRNITEKNPLSTFIEDESGYFSTHFKYLSSRQEALTKLKEKRSNQTWLNKALALCYLPLIVSGSIKKNEFEENFDAEENNKNAASVSAVVESSFAAVTNAVSSAFSSVKTTVENVAPYLLATPIAMSYSSNAKFVLSSFSLSALITAVKAQTGSGFYNTYWDANNPFSSQGSIFQTTDGNIVSVTGLSAGGADIIIQDSMGNLQSQMRLNTGVFYTALATLDNGIVVAGEASNATVGYAAKIIANEMVWAKTYYLGGFGGCVLTAGATCQNGDLVFVGQGYPQHPLILRINGRTGNSVWGSLQMWNTAKNVLSTVFETLDQQYLVLGGTTAYFGPVNMYLVLMSSDGSTFQWQNAYNPTSGQYPINKITTGFQSSNQNGTLILGGTYGDSSNLNIILAEVTLDGNNTLWTSINGQSSNIAGLFKTSNNTAILVGSDDSIPNNPRGLISEINTTNGFSSWAITTLYGNVYLGSLTNDGNILVGGDKPSPNNQTQLVSFAASLNPKGNLPSSCNITQSDYFVGFSPPFTLQTFNATATVYQLIMSTSDYTALLVPPATTNLNVINQCPSAPTQSTGNPTGAVTTPDTTSSSGSSTKWIAAGVGAGAAATAIGGVGLFAWHRHKNKNKENVEQGVELSTSKKDNPSQSDKKIFHHSLKPTASDKRRLIGDTYWVIENVSHSEADELFKQTGITTTFSPGAARGKPDFGNAGQFGIVGLALHKTTGQFVAYKNVLDDKVALCKREAELLKRLKGKPNIITYLDSAELIETITVQTNFGEEIEKDVPSFWLFMEPAGFGDGNTFAKHLANLNNSDEKEKLLLHLAHGLLTGLDDMHDEEIYHEDIKPSNLVFNTSGQLKIIDHGCDREVYTSSKQVTYGIQDPWYLPPEKKACMNDKNQTYDIRKIDPWSAGMTLLEMATNDHPICSCTLTLAEFQKDWNADRFQAMKNQHPELKKDHPKGSFWYVVKGLLEVDSAKRLSVKQALKILNPDPLKDEKTCANLFEKLKQTQKAEPINQSPVNYKPQDNDPTYAKQYHQSARKFEFTYFNTTPKQPTNNNANNRGSSYFTVAPKPPQPSVRSSVTIHTNVEAGIEPETGPQFGFNK